MRAVVTEGVGTMAVLERPDPPGPEKELDFLGVCCCGGGEFSDAVAVVQRNGPMLARLVSHEFPLEQAPDALRSAMNNPNEVMRVVIRGE